MTQKVNVYSPPQKGTEKRKRLPGNREKAAYSLSINEKAKIYYHDETNMNTNHSQTSIIKIFMGVSSYTFKNEQF
jgi:biopolymer transport protein ExbD